MDLGGAEVTPLAAVEVSMGPTLVRVLNISLGGLALLFDEVKPFSTGDILDISVSIRERAFPVQIEVKSVHGHRASCAFLDPSRAFQSALREFLKPKFLGMTLEKNDALSDRQDVLSMVEGTQKYEAYIGQNQSAVFVWLGHERVLLKISCVSQDLIFEWSPANGLKTGHMTKPHTETASDVDHEEIQWSRFPDPTLLHYFADILLAWLGPGGFGVSFVEELMGDLEGPTAETVTGGEAPRLKFPKPLSHARD